MKNLIRVSNIEEPVYLKKGWFRDYRVVHPTRNPDGSWNFINIIFGGLENFITLIIVLSIFLLLMYGFNQMLASCNDMAENPCKYFNVDCTRYYNSPNPLKDLNVSIRDVSSQNEQ